MKHVFGWLLVFVLLSCSSQPLPRTRNRIVVERRYGTSHEYFLLAVRPTQLVVAPYSPDAETNEVLYADASVIPISDVEHIVYHYGPTVNGMSWLLPIAGGLVGVGCGGCLDMYSNGSPPSIGQTYSFRFGLGGFLAGFALSFLTHSDDREYFVDTKAHLEQLKERAIFQNDEPPELEHLR